MPGDDGITDKEMTADAIAALTRAAAKASGVSSTIHSSVQHTKTRILPDCRRLS
jgi:hypothetical protein